jgi:hypothetical protein
MTETTEYNDILLDTFEKKIKAYRFCRNYFLLMFIVLGTAFCITAARGGPAIIPASLTALALIMFLLVVGTGIKQKQATQFFIIGLGEGTAQVYRVRVLTKEYVAGVFENMYLCSYVMQEDSVVFVTLRGKAVYGGLEVGDSLLIIRSHGKEEIIPEAFFQRVNNPTTSAWR